MIVRGIISGVSSVAYPYINPYVCGEGGRTVDYSKFLFFSSLEGDPHKVQVNMRHCSDVQQVGSPQLAVIKARSVGQLLHLCLFQIYCQTP